MSSLRDRFQKQRYILSSVSSPNRSWLVSGHTDVEVRML